MAYRDEKKVRMHRFLLGEDDSRFVDHINRDRLDNRRENLRYVTHSQNRFNASKNPSNKSGVKGVYWSKERQKWCVQITVNWKKMHLGRFDNFDDAVKARKEAEERYHKEYMAK